MSPDPCVFLSSDVVPWDLPAPAPAPAPFRELLATRQVVISGFPAAPLSAAGIVECAEILRGSVDAVLCGDSGAARVQFPPAYRAMLVQAQGLPVWAGVTCRDRNRVALEGEIAALAHVGVAGVHCVTGDHPRSGNRPDAAPVFDLESHELVALARAAGLVVSVAESPAAPPLAHRAPRLAEKVRAGADLCMLQYVGEVSDVADFVAAARAAGADVPVLPGVPVVVDVQGAQLLASFAAAVLPAGYVDAVLHAADPFTAGVEVALAYARELRTVDGVGGVVLAGGAAPGNEPLLARALAAVGSELRGT